MFYFSFGVKYSLHTALQYMVQACFQEGQEQFMVSFPNMRLISLVGRSCKSRKTPTSNLCCLKGLGGRPLETGCRLSIEPVGGHSTSTSLCSTSIHTGLRHRRGHSSSTAVTIHSAPPQCPETDGGLLPTWLLYCSLCCWVNVVM